MRVPAAVSTRSLLATAALGAMLALTGCASHEKLKPTNAVPVSDAAVEADAAKAAEKANAGVQKTAPSRLQKFLWVFSPYRPDVQQGNFVSSEMLAQLKTGMTREQVRFALGNPLLTDIFHADRWDYPFRLERGNGEVTSARVTVFFDKDDKVARWDGGNLPTEREYIAIVAGTLRLQVEPSAQNDKDKNRGSGQR